MSERDEMVRRVLRGGTEEACALVDQLAAARKRINDLEIAVANGMNDATRFVDRNGWLESEHERLKQRVAELEQEVVEVRGYMIVEGASAERRGATNTRLRALLRECDEHLRDWIDCLVPTDERLKWIDAQVDRSIVNESVQLKNRIDAELTQ